MKSPKRRKAQKGKKSAFNLIKLAVGFQYAFYPPFLDNRGMLIDKCRKLFIPGTPLNITFELPEGLTIRAKKPPIEIVLLPVKTIIRQERIFPMQDFDRIIKSFYDNLQGFYKGCKFEYVGAVIEIKGIIGRKYLSLKTPRVNSKYKYRINNMIENDARGIYTISLDTQKVEDVSFADITSILRISSKELEKIITPLQ
jgi:hypothetical protein